MCHEQIKKILEAHVGKENMITAPEIADLIGITPGPSGVNIRDLILETIKKYKLPVVSSNRGYYLLKENDEEDLKRYLASLQRRALKMLERGILVTMAFQDYYNKGELELGNELIGPDDFDPNEE